MDDRMNDTAKKPVYKRILVKLSGEALLGQEDYGIDPAILKRIAAEIYDVMKMGVQVAVVLGGGNIFRGAGLARAGMDRVTGDHMGMLATVINALAMQDAIEGMGAHARVMSALRINEVCEDYIRRRAVRHLEKGRVVIFGAGMGLFLDRGLHTAEGDELLPSDDGQQVEIRPGLHRTPRGEAQRGMSLFGLIENNQIGSHILLQNKYFTELAKLGGFRLRWSGMASSSGAEHVSRE
jgi:hypothetical protein